MPTANQVCANLVDVHCRFIVDPSIWTRSYQSTLYELESYNYRPRNPGHILVSADGVPGLITRGLGITDSCIWSCSGRGPLVLHHAMQSTIMNRSTTLRIKAISDVINPRSNLFGISRSMTLIRVDFTFANGTVCGALFKSDLDAFLAILWAIQKKEICP